MAAIGPQAAPHVLGLTGPIACGKTTVGDMVLQLGALERIDADQVVHELMEPNTEVTDRIRDEFGVEVIQVNGAVDRSRLGKKVFGDRASLEALERIVHPAVRKEIRRRISEMEGTEGVVVVDAVKLLQSDLLEMTGAVWVVSCRQTAQMQRLTEMRHMVEDDARARLEAQPSFSHSRVTTVIDNSGSMDELRSQVETAWTSLLDRWKLQRLQD